MYIRCFWQGNHHTYGHIRCIYTLLANPTHLPAHMKCVNPACSIFAVCGTGQHHVSHSYLFKKQHKLWSLWILRAVSSQHVVQDSPTSVTRIFSKKKTAMKCLNPAGSIFAVCRTGQPHVNHSYLFKKQHQLWSVYILRAVSSQHVVQDSPTSVTRIFSKNNTSRPRSSA